MILIDSLNYSVFTSYLFFRGLIIRLHIEEQIKLSIWIMIKQFSMKLIHLN